MIIISIIIATLIIIFSYILNKKIYNYEKLTAIECGLEPFEEKIGIETREKFYIKFYIIGITFLIFDLESILLYPLTIQNINYLNYYIFLIFIILVILGLLYEYNKKVLTD